jgi:formylglycine-generating enzyme required for sulfatase activity
MVALDTNRYVDLCKGVDEMIEISGSARKMQTNKTNSAPLRRQRRSSFERPTSIMLCVVLVLSCAIACGEDHSHTDRQISERNAALTEIARLQDLVGQRPGDHETLAKLATEYWVVGDYDNAQRSFARALEMSKDRGTALQLVGLLSQRGRFVEAVAVSKQFGLGDDDAGDLQWLRDLIALYDVSARQRPVTGTGTGRDAGVGAKQPQAEPRNSIGMVLVSVPGGRFDRGCDACEPDARPVRSITVAPLLFGKYEVTVAQYTLFMRETGYRRSAQTDGFDQTPDDHPAYGVSWHDARAFTIWLSAREQAVYRLPSEAEWEFAARGGAGNREPWGMEPGQPQVDGNWGRTSPADLRRSPPPTTPVGSFPKDRSAFGLFDMAGNVEEWCLDDYDASYYKWSPERNPFGPVANGGVRVLRGGAWNDPPGGSGFAVRRSRAAANQSYTGYGFRVIREVQ